MSGQRILLGLMLLAAGFGFGWKLHERLAKNDCLAAGGSWQPPGVCTGVSG